MLDSILTHLFLRLITVKLLKSAPFLSINLSLTTVRPNIVFAYSLLSLLVIAYVIAFVKVYAIIINSYYCMSVALFVCYLLRTGFGWCRLHPPICHLTLYVWHTSHTHSPLSNAPLLNERVMVLLLYISVNPYPINIKLVSIDPPDHFDEAWCVYLCVGLLLAYVPLLLVFKQPVHGHGILCGRIIHQLLPFVVDRTKLSSNKPN